MITTLTEEFLRSYNQRLMEEISEEMRTLEVKENCSASAVGNLFTTHLCIGKQKIESYGVREESSHLYIDQRSNSLNLRLEGVTLQFEFDFKLWSEPKWLHDVGRGTVSVVNTDVDLELALHKSDSDGLRVEVVDQKVHTRGYDVELKGANDISKAVENLLSSFKLFFEQELLALVS